MKISDEKDPRKYKVCAIWLYSFYLGFLQFDLTNNKFWVVSLDFKSLLRILLELGYKIYKGLLRARLGPKTFMACDGWAAQTLGELDDIKEDPCMWLQNI